MRVLAEGIRFAHTAVYVSAHCCMRVLAECIPCLAVAYRGPHTAVYVPSQRAYIICSHTAVYVSSYCCMRVFAEGIRCLAVAYRGSTRLISRSHVLLYPGACLLYLLLYLLLYCFTRCLADIAEARPPLSIQAPVCFTCCFTCCFTALLAAWLISRRRVRHYLSRRLLLLFALRCE